MKLLLDGSNAWYRAYTATQLTPPGGPMLIMTNMLKKLGQTYGIKNLTICWDAGHGGRREIDPNYKAQRVAVSGVWEHLVSMKKLINTLGVTTASLDGFEADDIIGSIAAQSKEEVLIVSYDKDFFQLVTDRIKVLRPARVVAGRQTPDVIVDVNNVLSDPDFECLPPKVVLVKTFRGDNSDNLPKVPIRFTAKFKTNFKRVLDVVDNVEDFYKHLEIFDEDIRSELLKFKPRALQNEAIVRIKTNLTVNEVSPKFDYSLAEKVLEECKVKAIKLHDWEKLFSPPIAVTQPKVVQRKLFD